jgi:hypothetical protein
MQNESLTSHARSLPLASAGLALAGLLAAGPALAETMLEQGEKNGIEYVHGGVGKSALKKIDQVEDEYDLKAVFTNARGAYLAEVEVTLRSVDGDHALDVTTSGPVLLADLPPGNYELEANVPGRDPATHTFTSRGKDRTRLFLQLED